jgi:hypothetical protein
MRQALKLSLAITLIAPAGVVAFAQPGAQPGAPPAAPPAATQPAPAPAPGPTPAPAAPPPAEADIAVRQRSTLSPQEMIRQSRDYRERMVQVLKRIEGLVEQAKKEKDIIRLNCLMDKLVQTRVNVNIAEQGIINLEDAVRRNDEGGALHEYTRVTIVNQKSQVLASEAEACVGEDLSFVGATRVDVDVDPGIRQDDPMRPGFDRPPFERPPVASPFK